MNVDFKKCEICDEEIPKHDFKNHVRIEHQKHWNDLQKFTKAAIGFSVVVAAVVTILILKDVFQ